MLFAFQFGVSSSRSFALHPLVKLDHTEHSDCHRTNETFLKFVESPYAKTISCIVTNRDYSANLGRIVTVLTRAQVDVAMYTYDNSSEWYDRNHPSWRPLVRHTMDVMPRKNKYFVCTKHLPLSTGRYSHVWFIDADLYLPNAAQIKNLLQNIYMYQAPISQPSVRNSDHRFVSWNKQCSVRSVNFVEIQTPVIRVAALEFMLSILPDYRTVDWGLDMMWCNYIRSSFNISHACIIVNSAHMSHPERKQGAKRWYSQDEGYKMIDCMRSLYAVHWIPKAMMLSCLKK